MAIENYYELLKLDPDASTEEIKSAINDNRAMWNRPQARAELKAIYDENRRNLPEIEKVMLGDASPSRDRMRSEWRSKQDQMRGILRTNLATMASGGYLLRGDLERVARSDSRMHWTAQEVEREARNLSIDIHDEAPVTESGVRPLERMQENQIASSVEFLQKTDLYDLLGLPSTAPLLSLQTAASSLLSEAQGSIEKNASVDTKSVLAGFCLELFSSDESRARYDETLNLALSRPLIDAAILYAGTEGDISAQELNMITRIGKSRGITREATQDILLKEAVKPDNDWTINVITECPGCHEPSPYYLIYCQNQACVTDLYKMPDDSCNECRSGTPALSDYCIHCGCQRLGTK